MARRAAGRWHGGPAWALLLCLFCVGPSRAAVRPQAALERAAAALRTGAYERALAQAAALARGARADEQAILIAARAEMALGRWTAARLRLEQATVKAQGWSLQAELVRVTLSLGDRGAVRELVRRLRSDDAAGKIDRRSAANLFALAVAARGVEEWEVANKLLRLSVLQATASKQSVVVVEANTYWGELLLEKHAADEAAQSFRAALAADADHPESHAGLARALIAQGFEAPLAEAELAAALRINPRLAAAWQLRAELALDAEDFLAVGQAIKELRRTDPADAAARALEGAAALLLDDGARFETAAEGASPKFFYEVSEVLVRHRRYDDAQRIAARGLALAPGHARLQASLGTTLLRLGQEAQGLALLRQAFDRDPYDMRIFNILSLFEKVLIPKYQFVEGKRLRFRVLPRDRALVSAVLAPQLDEIFAGYVQRYGFEPKGPVVLELYAAPEQFAVRTVGLPRLGLAGVCFGRIITAQSPAAGRFNWAQVLAHELAHVFALERSRSRAPRWFTEGLAERETARLAPRWRRQDAVAVAAWLQRNPAPSLLHLSRAFIDAKTPEDSVRAYLLSAHAVEYLETAFGFAAIDGLLQAYARGQRDGAALEAVTGASLAELDRGFRVTLVKEAGALATQFLPEALARAGRSAVPLLAAQELAEAGLRAVEAGDLSGAVAALEKARASKGENPTAGFLAGKIALFRGEVTDADEAFAQLARAGHTGFELSLVRGLVAVKRRQSPEALNHFRAAVAENPAGIEARVYLAEQLEQDGKRDEALTERLAILEREPQGAQLAREVAAGLLKARRWQELVRAAKVGLEIVPSEPLLHEALAAAQQALQQPADAAASFERALLFAPKDPRGIHRRLAGIYGQLGRTAAAAAHRAQADAGAVDAGRAAP